MPLFTFSELSCAVLAKMGCVSCDWAVAVDDWLRWFIGLLLLAVMSVLSV